MVKVIDWSDFQKENKAYLENKGLENPSAAEAFKLGQIAFISQIAEILGVSLTYNGLDWIEEIAKELKKYKDQEKGIDRDIYDKLFKTTDLRVSADELEYTEDGIKL